MFSFLWPSFILDNGDFLTRRYLAALLRLALPNLSNVNTYSFRIGGASAAFSAEVSDTIIKILGRWSSDCYQRYTRVADNIVISANVRMSTVRTDSSIWTLP